MFYFLIDCVNTCLNRISLRDFIASGTLMNVLGDKHYKYSCELFISWCALSALVNLFPLAHSLEFVFANRDTTRHQTVQTREGQESEVTKKRSATVSVLKVAFSFPALNIISS